ncbi:MAG: DUF354 domain-containing protein [Nitrososphaeria archaeon]
MKIWIDALTPKHYLFTKALEDKLLGESHDIIVTTREYEELERVSRRIRLRSKVNVVGRHGGGDIRRKLEESARRTELLAGLISRLSPSLAISFGSPEAARVAFGLGIPHVLICDSPHSEFVCRLTVPLSKYLLAPWVIRKKRFTAYGISSNRIIAYRSLDPTAWLYRKEIWPEKNDIERESEGAIVIRETEHMASYVKKHANFEDIARRVSERVNDRKVILLKRYERKLERDGNLIIYGGDFFGPNVLEKAFAFIGGGGTMNVESVLLGVKTLSLFPYRTDIERFLERKGCVKRTESLSDLLAKLRRGKGTCRLELPDAADLIYSSLKARGIVV